VGKTSPNLSTCQSVWRGWWRFRFRLCKSFGQWLFSSRLRHRAGNGSQFGWGDDTMLELFSRKI